ncbi:MAG: MFS transporter [Desulfobacteraceae bacterium]|nr:MFS transporter [Desulfobacteraceae bacterium]
MNNSFRVLLCGQFISQIGDKFYLLAIAYMVLKETHSPAMMGFVLFCSFFPSTVIGMISGVFVDRIDKKLIIILADIIRGIIILGVGIAFYYDSLDIKLIIFAQILVSICSAFFDPAIPAIIPQIVDKENLAKANSRTQLVRGICSVLGPVLGGMAVAMFGYFFIFLFNAASFIISGFFESFIKLKKAQKQVLKKQTIMQDFLDGFFYVWNDTKLILILCVIAILHLFVGSIEVIIPLLADWVDGNGLKNLGFLQASFGLGILLTGLLIGFCNINDKEEKLIFFSLFCVGIVMMGIMIIMCFQIKVVLPFMLCLSMISSFIITAAICFRTIIQKKVDQNIIGRVFGFITSISNGSIPLSIFLYGILFSYIKMEHLIFGTGFFMSLISFVLFIKYNPKKTKNIKYLE